VFIGNIELLLSDDGTDAVLECCLWPIDLKWLLHWPYQ